MKPYSLLFLGGWGISLLVSCTAEEDALYAEDAAQGRIVLSMPQLEPFLEVRAEQTLTDFAGYTFTLKGTNSDGWTVNETLQGAVVVCDEWTRDEATGQYANYITLELQGEEFLKKLFEKLGNNNNVNQEQLRKLLLQQIEKAGKE